MSDHNVVRARKRHRCQYCGLGISISERYVRISIKPWDHPDNDGYALVKVHQRCDRFMESCRDPRDDFIDYPYYDGGFHRDMARHRVGLPVRYWEPTT